MKELRFSINGEELFFQQNTFLLKKDFKAAKVAGLLNFLTDNAKDCGRNTKLYKLPFFVNVCSSIAAT